MHAACAAVEPEERARARKPVDRQARTPSVAPAPNLAGAAESRLVEALRAGEEDAFASLVRLHGPAMLRIARMYTSNRATAEEVVQETWVGVVTGVGRFEGRSSFRTWLFRILVNRAKARAVSERRTVAFPELSAAGVADAEVPEAGHEARGASRRGVDHWTSSSPRWGDHPEESVISQETVAIVERAATSLPAAQRAVVILRDVVGCDAHEVCAILGVTATNQRVLLHRARTKIRTAVEHELGHRGQASPT